MKIQVTENIRKIREGKGYSQQYLAMKLKISQQYYQQIESGNKNLTLEKMESIADILDVPINSFLETENDILKEKTKMEKLLAEVSSLKDLLYNFIEKMSNGGGKTLIIKHLRIKKASLSEAFFT